MPGTTLSKVALGAKLLELILACVCIALYENSYNKQHYTVLLPIVFGGYILICGVVLIGIFSHNHLPRLLDLIWSAVGLVLFVSAGAVALDIHTKYIYSPRTGVAMGSIAVINGFIFGVDLLVTYKDVNEYNPQ